MAMRKLLSASVVVFSMGMTGSVCAQDYQKGLQAYEAKDYAKALKEWRYLAERGHPEAQRRLGIMFANGQGVIQDYKQAVGWYRASAEQGYALAQGNLGACYFFGTCFIQDNVYAHMWFNIAASLSDSESREGVALIRDDIAKKMTAAEIAKAQELARECVKKQYKGC